MKHRNTIMGLIGTLLILGGLFPINSQAEQIEEVQETTVLFTHDLHSHFLPQPTEDGGESGGYARLATILNEEREKYPNALTLDGGDFSVGSLIQALYQTKAPELRTMGVLGYDAAAVGNHEFDHTNVGFERMLNAARKSGDTVPPLLMANYKPSSEHPNQLDIQRTMSAYGVRETLLIKRGGVTYGLFGLMGKDAHDMAPTSGFVLEDPIQAARRCVESLEEQGAEFIICLSHSGTDEVTKNSEDEQLAKQVDGIDLIVSGHTHTTLEQPIVVNDTYIVSAGPYCENLGSITLEWTEDGDKELKDYRLIPIDETVTQDPEVSALVEQWKNEVSRTYLSAYGLTYDQVLTYSDFSLQQPASGVQEGNALGELVSDAFRWAVQKTEGEKYEPITLTVTADGVLRADLPEGEITTSQAFDVLSMGVGEDSTSGFPLVSCYLTGQEIKDLLEIDATITKLMPEAQLYISGMEYTINPHRWFLNRVVDCTLVGEDGSKTKLEDDKLYRVVSGMYSAQMLSTVKEQSFGLLSLVPKDKNGEPIEDFSQYIIYQSNGSELKEWYALAAYLQSFGEDGIPPSYAKPDGRKEVSQSWNPIELLKNPNRIAWTVWIVFAIVVIVLVVVVRKTSAWRRRKGGGYRRRRLW